jgi:transcriptional regulator with XRE-family HTH domain
MKITSQLTDDALLGELGSRFARIRIDRRLTQAQLAEQAGVSKRTVERLERGEAGTQLWGFLRLCRVLGLVERLDVLLPEPEPSPLELMKLRGRLRRRVRPARPAMADNLLLAEAPAKPWRWGDEA